MEKIKTRDNFGNLYYITINENDSLSMAPKRYIVKEEKSQTIQDITALEQNRKASDLLEDHPKDG